MMELDIALDQRSGEAIAKVYEAAGGYAPTIGIIGAVLGLIQVMKHLENIEEVGRGIAVAFVATVYGVASANLFFLPAANKIKARFHHALHIKELMLEGVCSIVEGLNPKLIRVKLEAFAEDEAESAKKARGSGNKGGPAGRCCRGLIHAEETRSGTAGKSRTLAGFLRGFHHLAVCLLCSDVRFFSNRQRPRQTGL